MSDSSFDDLFSGLHSYGTANDKKKEEKPAIKKAVKPVSKPVNKQVVENKPVDKPANSRSKYISKLPTFEQNTNDTPKKPSGIRGKLNSKPQAVNKGIRSTSIPNKKKYDPSDPVITPDGKTLSDMLPHLSGDRSSTIKYDNATELVHKAKDLNSEVKTPARGRHIEKIKNKTEEYETRRKLASKYVQRNNRYTQDEKIIMTNLGMTAKDLTDVMKMPEEKLTKGDKLRILAAGSAGNERYFKGKMFRATRGDNDMLEFLSRFKLANTRTLSIIRGENQKAANRRLKRLRKNGLVADYEIPGLGTVWTVTEVGMALAGNDLQTYRQRRPKMSVLPPIIGINYVAACLWHNSYNVLFLDDYPAHNKTMFGNDGKTWTSQGEDLVSELEIRSSWGRELKPNEGSTFGVNGGTQDIVIHNAQMTWRKWVSNGKDVDSPETYIGNEYLWILFPEGGMTVSFHVPDLVIKRKRNDDGTPESIAVECELSRKSHKNYVNTMRAYMEDKYLYKKVIWITNSSAIERRLRDAAKEIGFKNFDIVPFTNQDGIFRNRDIWYI